MRASRLLLPLLLVPVAAGCGKKSSGASPLTFTSTFSVPAGQEVTKCMTIYLHNDKPFDFNHVSSHMSAGSHHLILYTDASKMIGQAPPPEGIADCKMDAARIYVYGAQEADHEIDMPPGVAGQIPKDSIAILEAHYVNASSSEIQADVDVTFDPAPQPVEQYAGVLFYMDTSFSIPAGAGYQTAPYSHTTSCAVPGDVNVFRLGSHAHHRMTEFDIDAVSAANGKDEPLYRNSSWSSPFELRYPDDAPLTMKSGDDLKFTCSWMNETTAPIGFGLSAISDEMCIAVAGYYPRIEGSLGINGLVFCDDGTLYY